LYVYRFESRPLSISLLQQREQRPPHIHVKAAEHEAKFWLDPVQLAANYGFNGSELTEIERIIREHRDELLEAWHERFG
jgi:hypothetical protein